MFNYKFITNDNDFNNSKIQKISFQCAGNLIDRETVLTAAHCLPTEIDHNLINQNRNLKVVPNSFYPTYESMFTIYLGLHDLGDLFDNTTNGTFFKAEVLEAKRVYRFNLFKLRK